MRFIQEDPAGWAGGPNLYAYGDGDPTTGRDPDGLSKNYDLQANAPNQFAHCLGTFNGCTEADPWQAELDAEFALAGIQDLVAYSIYERNARARIAEHGLASHGIQPLSRDEWTRARAAVAGEGPRSMRSIRLGLFDWASERGSYLIDSRQEWTRYRYESGHMGAQIEEVTAQAMPGFGAIFMNPNLFDLRFLGRRTIAEHFVHEPLHLLLNPILNPLMGPEMAHCVIYHVSSTLTNSRSSCR